MLFLKSVDSIYQTIKSEYGDKVGHSTIRVVLKIEAENARIRRHSHR